MSTISIAIDGPSGAGKSTLARSIAAKLGYLYVDTGAIYRTIGYHIFTKGIDPKDAAAVTAQLPEVRVELTYGEDGLQHMLLNGVDVTKEIRLPEISMYASAVSAHPGVRAFLLEMQRQLARSSNVIMDGRDIGTVVLPDANVKIFLTASPEAGAGAAGHSGALCGCFEGHSGTGLERFPPGCGSAPPGGGRHPFGHHGADLRGE